MAFCEIENSNYPLRISRLAEELQYETSSQSYLRFNLCQLVANNDDFKEYVMQLFYVWLNPLCQLQDQRSNSIQLEYFKHFMVQTSFQITMLVLRD